MEECRPAGSGKRLMNPFTRNKGEKCFGCSKTNEHGLHLEFTEEGEFVVCRWRPDPRFQSWDGVLHGGITTTMIDETAGWAVMRRFQRSAMTTRIDVRFLKPVPVVDRPIVARARYKGKVNDKIVKFHAVVEDPDGNVCVEADADYYVMDEARSKAMGFTSCDTEDERPGARVSAEVNGRRG